MTKNLLLSIVVCLLLLGCTMKSYSQFIEENKKAIKFDKKKLRYGGDFWLSFGRYTYINVSPKIGYKLTERFTPGVGAIFQYYREETHIMYMSNNGPIDTTYVHETTIYGASVMASYILIHDFSKLIRIDVGSLVAHAEYNILNVDHYSKSFNGYYVKDSRRWINRLLVGGGFSYKISKRSSISLMILWDIIKDSDSPYSNPIVQIGLSL